jgi:hypothetical protein
MLLLAAAASCGTQRSAGSDGPRESVAHPASSPNPPVILPEDGTFEVMRIAFDAPADFVAGRFEWKPEPSSGWMNDALVLVETAAAESVDVRSIAFGEVAAISVHPLNRATSGWHLTRFVKPERERHIGGHLVNELPDLFGLGHHFYVMPLSDRSAVMFIADRFHGNPFWSKGPPVATDYDLVIKEIIGGARFVERVAVSDPP